MSYENIQVESEEAIVCITINRPKKLNALNRATIRELQEAFEEANEDPNARLVILTGSGEKAFVAGADISEFSDYSVREGSALAREGQDNLFDLIENMNKPVIAAINGFALGGGLELAMAAHFRLASHNAKMGPSRNFIRAHSRLWWDPATSAACGKGPRHGNDHDRRYDSRRESP